MVGNVHFSDIGDLWDLLSTLTRLTNLYMANVHGKAGDRPTAPPRAIRRPRVEVFQLLAPAVFSCTCMAVPRLFQAPYGIDSRAICILLDMFSVSQYRKFQEILWGAGAGPEALGIDLGFWGRSTPRDARPAPQHLHLPPLHLHLVLSTSRKDISGPAPPPPGPRALAPPAHPLHRGSAPARRRLRGALHLRPGPRGRCARADDGAAPAPPALRPHARLPRGRPRPGARATRNGRRDRRLLLCSAPQDVRFWAGQDPLQQPAPKRVQVPQDLL
ncbi:hypothetical protein CERSUDRAFT_125351, partial [Gelatoporia subvermispora B]